MKKHLKSTLHTLSLFGSMSTLLCCALPALLVALGMGASLAGLVGTFPGLTWTSQHKVLVFSISGILILTTGILRYAGRNAACPVDQNKAEQCGKLRKVSKYIYATSLLCYLVGFFFAFIGQYVI